jgi:hypothetical protein
MREAISLHLEPLTRIMPIDPVPAGVAMAAMVSSNFDNLVKNQISGEEEDATKTKITRHVF